MDIRRVRPLRDAAQHGLDPGQKLLHAERLDHVIIGAAVQPADAVRLVAPGGEDDDRQRRPQTADLAENLQAVAAGQHEVQQQQVAGLRQGHFQSLVAVPGLQGSITGESQGIDNAPADRRIVLDG